MVAPNVWAGIGYLGDFPTVGIVGSYEQAAARLDDLVRIGADALILSGLAHLEEAHRVGEEVLPLFQGRRAVASTAVEPAPSDQTVADDARRARRRLSPGAPMTVTRARPHLARPRPLRAAGDGRRRARRRRAPRDGHAVGQRHDRLRRAHPGDRPVRAPAQRPGRGPPSTAINARVVPIEADAAEGDAARRVRLRPPPGAPPRHHLGGARALAPPRGVVPDPPRPADPLRARPTLDPRHGDPQLRRPHRHPDRLHPRPAGRGSPHAGDPRGERRRHGVGAQGAAGRWRSTSRSSRRGRSSRSSPRPWEAPRTSGRACSSSSGGCPASSTRPAPPGGCEPGPGPSCRARRAPGGAADRSGPSRPGSTRRRTRPPPSWPAGGSHWGVRITHKVDYGIRAMVDLATCEADRARPSGAP